jgi:biopolymer transport protein ExbD
VTRPRLPRLHGLLWIMLLLPSVGGACQGNAPVETACPIGSEGCPCTQGGSCDPELVCAAGACERSPTDETAPEHDAAILEVPGTIELPVTAPREPAPSLVLGCTHDGDLFLDGLPVESDERLAELLVERVKEAPNIQGVLQCDGKAPVARLVALIDILRAAGVRKYAIATSAEETESPH